MKIRNECLVAVSPRQVNLENVKYAAAGMTFAVVLALSAAGLFAQTLGEITGYINDATGSAVPGAVVTLTSVSTNAVRSTTSTQSGDYSLPSVPPGTYNVRVEHQGFKVVVSNNVELQVQQTVRLDFTLQVGAVSESIEVSAAAAQLQSENATVGTVIENQEILQLPLNGRNYLGLVALAPNVNTISPASGQAGSRHFSTAVIRCTHEKPPKHTSCCL